MLLETEGAKFGVQGRARPSLANLYNWRYQQLGDLPNVRQQPAYQQANPGLAFEYQFINVPDYYLPNDPNPRGESEPISHFYQVCCPLQHAHRTAMYCTRMYAVGLYILFVVFCPESSLC